jgi:hypothetical protein
VRHRLCLDNGLGDCPLAFDDEMEQMGLNSLRCRDRLEQGWFPYLLIVQNCGLDDGFHEVQFGWDVQKIVLERLSLYKSKESMLLF